MIKDTVKIINLLDNLPSKTRTENWVEINNDSRGMYNIKRQKIFKTTRFKSFVYTCTKEILK